MKIQNGDPYVIENKSINFGIGDWQVQNEISEREVLKEIDFLIRAGRIRKENIKAIPTRPDYFKGKRRIILECWRAGAIDLQELLGILVNLEVKVTYVKLHKLFTPSFWSFLSYKFKW
jgi:hypothetical protein